MTAKNKVASQISSRTSRIASPERARFARGTGWSRHPSGFYPSAPARRQSSQMHRLQAERPAHGSSLRNGPSPTTLTDVADSFSEFEASSLFCGRCKRATPVRKQLLLVLPTGNKYDYLCSACGAAVGGKTDSDATDFHARAPRRPQEVNPPRRLR